MMWLNPGMSGCLIVAHTTLTKMMMTILWRGPGSAASKMPGGDNWFAVKDKLEKRRDYLTGLAPHRFGNVCTCGECATFRYDIQNTELIESIEAAMDTLLDDEDLTDEQKDIIEAEFDEMIEDLKNGDIQVDDFFGKYWKGNKDEHDDDADDSSA